MRVTVEKKVEVVEMMMGVKWKKKRYMSDGRHCELVGTLLPLA